MRSRTSLIIFSLFAMFLTWAIVAPVSADPRLRIATWNFGFLAEKDGVGCFPRTEQTYARLREYARRLDADIVAVQEVENAAALARVFDPAAYDFYVADSFAFSPSPCQGLAGQSLIEQRVGFAVRKAITAQITITSAGAFEDLAVSSESHRLRPGLQLQLTYKGTLFHLMAVHLKSGCPDKSLPDKSEACTTLLKQAKILERWIDERTGRGERVIVLGDFNRRLAVPGDAFWNEIDDSEPSNSDLDYVSLHGLAECGPYTEPIDHIIVDKGTKLLIDERSVRYLKYDEPWARAPADHCPLTIDLELRTAVPSGVAWMRQSAEYKAIARATFRNALARLDAILSGRPQGGAPWTVVLDADETTFDNLDFQLTQALQFKGFDENRWKAWVDRSEARLVPGAKAFIEAVMARGGKIAIITNRDAAQNDKTRLVLQNHGISADASRLCVLGRGQEDRKATNPSEWESNGYANDKDRRRRLLREGKAEACWAEARDVREVWSQPQEILLQIGDNVEDYSGFSQTALQADPSPLNEALGRSFFLLPNPLYGSWE